MFEPLQGTQVQDNMPLEKVSVWLLLKGVLAMCAHEPDLYMGVANPPPLNRLSLVIMLVIPLESARLLLHLLKGISNKRWKVRT